MKKLIITLVVILILALCAGCAVRVAEVRVIEDGPQEWTITLYAESGKLIGNWEGRYSIDTKDGFVYATDEQGRTMIIGGTLLVKEVAAKSE